MTRRPRLLVVVVTDALGRVLADQRALGTWLAKAAPARAKGDVTIALVSDVTIRRLNRLFRSHDVATDVLSFPALGRPARRGAFLPARSEFLGDIVIARGVSGRQARRAGHSEAVERRILALHGLLHLLGYDHDTDEGVMRKVEERLRRRAGLPAGLIARARRPSR